MELFNRNYKLTFNRNIRNNKSKIRKTKYKKLETGIEKIIKKKKEEEEEGEKEETKNL